MPYDANGTLEEQLAASVASSLANLATLSPGGSDTPYLDSLLLHAPLPTTTQTLQALGFLADNYVPHRIRHLGISNVPLGLLKELCADAGPRTRPRIVQNPFRASGDFEGATRRFCLDEGIAFQGFSVLLGAGALLRSRFVVDVALDPAVAVGFEAAYYALFLGLGGTAVLNGTQTEDHMRKDLEGVAKVGAWAEGDGSVVWERSLGLFKGATGHL